MRALRLAGFGIAEPLVCECRARNPGCRLEEVR